MSGRYEYFGTIIDHQQYNGVVGTVYSNNSIDASVLGDIIVNALNKSDKYE